ncbi:MAG: hypothetical protein K2L24_03060 [Opitutales bacterium]|nr:hypothetical protein [Opitutales bacterium]
MNESENLEPGAGEAENVKATTVGGQAAAPDTSIIGDLKELETMTFGTRWTPNENAPSGDRPPRRPFNKGPRRGNFSGPRDRNSFQRPRNDSNAERSDTPRTERPPRREGEFRDRKFSKEGGFRGGPRRFQERRIVPPPFEVQFYQEDQSFDLLLEEMRKSGKTYELFTVAKLILQKPERFVVTIRRKPDAEGVIAPLYLSLLDDLPFESEREAMMYIVDHHVAEFFDIQEEEVEPPKGSFTCVHRCGITGQLLSAPNYHRYKTILRDHFNSKIHSMSFERFLTKIETTKDEADIQQWVESMRHKVTYTPKALDESITDLAPIETLEGVRNYLLKYYRDRILRDVTTVRILGTACASLPSVPLLRAINFYLTRQRQFPLDTANNLRNRFRRAGFGIYRKGKNGISYVCAMKRKFRTDEDVFTPTIHALITFLEPLEKIDLAKIQHGYIEANQLAESEVLEGLNWLIHEGYVVAYENGELFLNPKLPAPKPKEEAPVIALEMRETAIEQRTDGTLTVSQETTLLIPEQEVKLDLLGEIPEENPQKE